MRGSLKQREPGVWYLRVELERNAKGRRRQQRVTFHGTKAAAEKRLRELLREIETGTHAEGGRVLLSVMAADWLRAIEHRVGARTLANYAGHVNHFIVPALGSIRVEALRPAHVEAALTSWMSGGINRRRKTPTKLSTRTIHHIFGTLRAMCSWGVQMGVLSRDPAAAVKPPQVTRKEMRALDPAGVADLLAAFAGTELEHAVTLAVGTGLRLGEVLGLQWNDIDLEGGRLSVRRSRETLKGVTRSKSPKTKQSVRTIALPRFVADVLQRRKAVQNERRMLLGLGRGDDHFVFTRADETPWNPHVFSMTFARIVKKSAMPRITFHGLRHTFGTLAVASGVDLKTVSSALGHSTIGVTANVYLHAVDSLKEDAAVRIDTLLGKAVGDGMRRGSSDLLRATTVPREADEFKKTS